MSIVGTEKINPRHLREKYTGWDNKRVIVGMTTDHYLCGTWLRIDGDKIVFSIAGKEMEIALAHVDNIADASPYQADFFK